MAYDDIRGKYKLLLDGMYPGEAIDVPSAFVIGGDAPALSVDFGIVKEGGVWRIPESFRGMVEPVLLREAYRAGFPAKTAKAPSMVHACNWFAWKSIDDKAIQKRFFDTWLAASAAEKPTEAVYSLPPAWLREIDKSMDIDPRELHGLLVRYSAENERLLGKQLRYDAAEQWAFHKAIELAPVPGPAVIELLYAFSAQYLEIREPPARQWLIDKVVAAPRFANSHTAARISAAFPAFSNLSFAGKQVDVSLTGHRYMEVIFTLSESSSNIDWGALLNIPGMSLGLFKTQGAVMQGGEVGQSYLAPFSVPSVAIDAMFEYLSTLAATGIFVSYHAYIIGDGWWTVNYNCYVPHLSSPMFLVNPVRDEPDLFLRSMINYSSTPERAAMFMACVVAEGYKQIRAFVDKATSPFSLNAARYDSWLATMANEARVSSDVARRWLDLLDEEYKYLISDPRSTYLFTPRIGAMTRVAIIMRGNLTSSDRARMAALFPSSYSASLRGVRIPDVTLWMAFAPQGQLERTMHLVYQLAPEARPSVVIDNPLVRFAYHNIGWFDGTGYARAVDAIQRYTAAIPRVARGEWTIMQFQRDVTRPVEESFNSI
jgi:hypothetical protein